MSPGSSAVERAILQVTLVEHEAVNREVVGSNPTQGVSSFEETLK